MFHGSSDLQLQHMKKGGGSGVPGIRPRVAALERLAVKRRRASRASAQLMESQIT